ncbi:GLPGLI family protein [Flaviaesturariibacter amylovorans]|uniref:GLPGLI family protein n=1 Tax=Flaviaesturariibacter amylovorans TaxID=1084520 RepID=A0ABP8HG92_9BACT
MKKWILPICLLVTGTAGAQKKEGTIVYERTMQMRRPANMDPEIAARFPAARTDNFELLYANNQSLWRVLPKADGGNGDIVAQGSGGNVGVFRMAGGNDEIYTNIDKSERVEKRELFDAEFVVTDSVRRLPWKITGESKTILGHNAQKAVAQRIGTRMAISMEAGGEMKRTPVADTSTIVAWFSTDIPVTVGPGEYQGQLPGVILEVDVNNGRTVYKAVEISPKVSVAQIREPKGKRYTQAQYEKERDRLMEEMRKNMPAGAQIRIQN